MNDIVLSIKLVNYLVKQSRVAALVSPEYRVGDKISELK